MKINFILTEILFFILVALLVVFSFLNRNCAVWVFLVYVIGTAAMLISAKINIQKKKIQETEDSKNRIVKLMNIINSYVVIWNEDASILLINDKFRSVLSEDVLRLERSEILDILFPGGFVSKSKAEMMLSGPKEYSLDSRLGNIYINWTSSLLIGSDGEGGIIVSIGFDVTENKMIRQQLNLTNNLLATSEKHYSLAMNLSEIGIILNEHCAETFHISEELQKMLGIVGDTIRIDDFIGLIHKDERMLFESYLKAARANSIRVDHTNSMDLRIRSYDGRYRWYTFRYKNSQKGQYGMPVIGGAIIDISKDRKRTFLLRGWRILTR